jgi:dGTPase
LQGKTQLFPNSETDFFRNRLTHSLEVAQIAKSIAIRINNTVHFFERPGFEINTDLVETAALVHDIGHPPFGHNGEKALDRCMHQKGGFEGNAQTLRILAKVEKREKLPGTSPIGIMTADRSDGRRGLNLCYRTLAAALKYDREIPYDRPSNDGLKKGYYSGEADLVARIKRAVTGVAKYPESFKTIECQIMDIADDIAYSTYDLEDSLKAKFLTPFAMFGASGMLMDAVLERVRKSMGPTYSRARLLKCLFRIFEDLFDLDEVPDDLETAGEEGLAIFIAAFASMADKLMTGGYRRSLFTSDLVGQFISGIEVDPNYEIPALSSVKLKRSVLEKVEVLKHFTYCSLIASPRLKVAEYRGLEIVRELFEVLTDRDGEGERLLPEDVLTLFGEIRNEDRDRVICDFIAGMTDRYAIEFYGRLKSERPETIFKPH